jgi:hypothetical protein
MPKAEEDSPDLLGSPSVLDPVRTPVFAQVRITITENLALVIMPAHPVTV